MDANGDLSAELVRRHLAGDAAAFEMLYDLHQESLRRWLLREERNERFVDDACQAAWTNVWRSLKSGGYSDRGTFRGFLFKVGLNALRDEAARSRRYRNADHDELEALFKPAEPDPRLEALERCVQALPERLRNVLQRNKLDDVEGLDARSLAVERKTTANAIHKQVFRARQLLRKCMKAKTGVI